MQPSIYRANAKSLGALESEHRLSRDWAIRPVGYSAALIALGAVLTAWMTNGFAPHNRASFSSASEQWLVSLVVGGSFVGLGLAIFLISLVSRFWLVRVHEQGLVYRSFERTTTIRWDEVTLFWKAEATFNGRDHLEYRVGDADGRRLSLSPRLAQIRLVGERIESEIWKRRLPAARDAHARGESLMFGAFTLTSMGLGHQETQLVWQEIAVVRAGARHIAVWTPNGTAPAIQLETADVPNVEILVSLLAEHTKVVR